jgi:predicted metal-dependent phosphoesterase TrpH
LDLSQIETFHNGSRFYRCDLHVHSFGASHDVKDATLTPEAIVDTAVREGLSVIAITDHNEISSVQRAVDASQGKSVILLPGVELSTPQGQPYRLLLVLQRITPPSQLLHLKSPLRDYNSSLGETFSGGKVS